MINLNFKLDKKKLMIIIPAILIILIIVIGFFIYKKNQEKNIQGEKKVEKVFVPEFMSTEEKTKLQIPVETKIQAVTRDANGDVKVYRIIRNDSDVIDPAKVGPISPRMKK
jgi:uncharacterized protein YneF (UPF0154 family)